MFLTVLRNALRDLVKYLTKVAAYRLMSRVLKITCMGQPSTSGGHFFTTLACQESTTIVNTRNLYYALPSGLRYVIRRLYYLPVDTYTWITGKRHKYEPPKGMTYIGSGDFIRQGNQQVELLIALAGLRPDADVLDIGSGIGRTAAALTGYLSSRGSYHGFDIVKFGVEWCNARIGKDHPNFHFRYVPLGNDLYNTQENNAVNFRFPYDDAKFDVSFLFSVFSHLLPGEIGHYLTEISRTLKPGGMCLFTAFVYDNANEESIASAEGFHFPVDKGTYRLMSERVRSANVALHEEALLEFIQRAGLEMVRREDGYWKMPKTPGAYFQDIFVVQKH